VAPALQIVFLRDRDGAKPSQREEASDTVCQDAEKGENPNFILRQAQDEVE
jgi:hypothetical protein